jgi:hypothetical protein
MITHEKAKKNSIPLLIREIKNLVGNILKEPEFQELIPENLRKFPDQLSYNVPVILSKPYFFIFIYKEMFGPPYYFIEFSLMRFKYQGKFEPPHEKISSIRIEINRNNVRVESLDESYRGNIILRKELRRGFNCYPFVIENIDMILSSFKEERRIARIIIQ